MRFTRIVEPGFNTGTWLKSILKHIRFNDLLLIHVGFSFIATNKDEKIYLFCPKSLAPYTAKCIDKTEAMDFADDLEKMNQSEHLQNTFINTTDTGNPFEEFVNLVHPTFLVRFMHTFSGRGFGFSPHVRITLSSLTIE